MTIYRIREKFWSVGAVFIIEDDAGMPRFRVRGKAFSWGDDLSLQDPDGRPLARIRQTLLSWKPRYQIEVAGRPFAEVVKEWTWFKKRFTLDVPGPNDYAIQGSFWDHEFEFLRAGKTVAHASKKRWSWTDSYGVAVDDDEDHVAILCACIVIDQVLDDQQGAAHAATM